MQYQIMFNGRDALNYYGLALGRCTLSAPVRKQKWVNIPGRDGSVELMAETGLITYENRTLRAEFRSSRPAGERLDLLLHDLEGRWVDIRLPGDYPRYMRGVCHVAAVNCPGYDVVITANCLPWRYDCMVTTVPYPGTAETVSQQWYNHGDMPVVPTLTIPAGSVLVGFGEGDDANIVQLYAGTHILPELVIPPRGSITVYLIGDAFETTYREAIL